MALPFKLSLATTADIPLLARISDSAFKQDTHTQLKAIAGKNPNPNEHIDMMTSVLSSWMSRPPERCQVVKAELDADAGESEQRAIGWACWATATAEPASETSTAATVPVKPAREEIGRYDGSSGTPKLEQLSAITGKSLQGWQEYLSPWPGSGEKCMVLVAIVIAPEYQRQGVGSALIGWGTKKADEMGVTSWVSSSDAGWRAFKGKGFEVMGELRVDLDEFAEDGSRNPDAVDGKWGMYVWRAMRRASVKEIDVRD
ncbi:hypothetical protein BP6252_00741 [Coleophoma cylindrospora]|uniref:N-acetyltransferase domain-containing protein n=1 Tax=Coleophoma cylindrospora TaxID=1849047 RepID=A0A3D8SQX3_9HELO|nr:hypothetical protein BP6252_00741 [Coleophoma cylindrospora]